MVAEILPASALAHPVMAFPLPLDVSGKNPLVLIGPSLSWSRLRGRNELVVGMDLTLACQMEVLTKALGHIDLFHFMHGWVSLGATSSIAPDQWVAPYVELGLWLFVNVGVGYGLMNKGDGWRHGPHLFAGLPITLGDGPTARHWVIEPYYRHYFSYHPRSTERANEVGLLMKWGGHVGDK
jgi:hypothetical protein